MKPTEIDWMYEGHPWKGVVEPSALNELSRARVLMHIPTDTELSMCLVVHLCSRFQKKTKEDPSADWGALSLRSIFDPPHPLLAHELDPGTGEKRFLVYSRGRGFGIWSFGLNGSLMSGFRSTGGQSTRDRTCGTLVPGGPRKPVMVELWEVLRVERGGLGLPVCFIYWTNSLGELVTPSIDNIYKSSTTIDVHILFTFWCRSER